MCSLRRLSDGFRVDERQVRFAARGLSAYPGLLRIQAVASRKFMLFF
jgi:hypothetical protein